MTKLGRYLSNQRVPIATPTMTAENSSSQLEKTLIIPAN